MTSQELLQISTHPFFRHFVFSVIQTIKAKNIKQTEERSVIHADMVPRIPQKAMELSMKKNIEPLKPSSVSPVPTTERPLPSPQPAPHKPMRPPTRRPVVPPRAAPVQKPTPTVPLNIQRGPIDEKGEYGKISPLLNDPSISTIECSGHDKELMIIRAGQRQKTRITLSAKEIKEILDYIADTAHIPLIEGVFRASVQGISVSAVVSEIIGSRFVIKKATAYGLIE